MTKLGMIRSRLTIVDVVGTSIRLRGKTDVLTGSCPWCGGMLAVKQPQESWKCDGCESGGDMFSFVMKRDAVNFEDALNSIYDMATLKTSV